MTAVERIKSETKSLNRSERLELTNELLNSLTEDDVANEQDSELLAELERRSEAVQSGEMKVRPLDEIMAELKARYDRP